MIGTLILTGSSGLIGRRLLELLVHHCRRIVCIDPVPSDLIGMNKALCDVVHVSSLAGVDESIVQDCDIFIHGGGISDLEIAEDDVIGAVRNNILGAVECAELALKVRCKNFIFLSSMHVYNTNASVYGITKTASESLLLGYSKKGFTLGILRLCSLYDNDLRSSNYILALKDLVQRARNTEVLFSNQKRDLLDNREFCAWLVRELTERGEIDGIFDINGAYSVEANTVVSILAEMYSVDAKNITLASNGIQAYGSGNRFRITPFRFKKNITGQIDIPAKKTFERLLFDSFYDVDD